MDFPSTGDLSFVIGAFLGDGSFVEDSDYHHHVKLAVRDEDFADSFNESVSKILGRKPNKLTVTHNIGSVYYESKYSSRSLGLFLKQPVERFRHILDAYPGPFLRGLFSADGCAAVTAENAGLRVEVVLGNSNPRILRVAESLLWAQYQIHSKTYLTRKSGTTWMHRGKRVILRKDAYLLRIQRGRDVRLFVAKIGFEIRRKQEAIENAIRLIDTLGRVRALEAWKSLYIKKGFRWQKVS